MIEDRALVSIPADPHGREYDSKAMSRLTTGKRKFVIGMLQEGVNPKAHRKCAIEAGFVADYGRQLMRDPDILAALREEATKRIAGAALVGINVMLEIAQNPDHKDQYRAAKDLAGINGFTAEQRIVVEHIGEDSKDLLRQVRDMAKELGLDPALLVKGAGIIEAEFEEVREHIAPAAVDDSDW